MLINSFQKIISFVKTFSFEISQLSSYVIGFIEFKENYES